MLWRHVCLLIRAATVHEMSRACLFSQLQIFIYTFTRHSSLQTGVARLALRIIIIRCYATVIVTVRFLGVSGDGENKQLNKCKARSVNKAYHSCLSVHTRNKGSDVTVQPATRLQLLSRWWRNHSKPEPRTPHKRFFFLPLWCAKCAICSTCV